MFFSRIALCKFENVVKIFAVKKCCHKTRTRHRLTMQFEQQAEWMTIVWVFRHTLALTHAHTQAASSAQFAVSGVASNLQVNKNISQLLDSHVSTYTPQPSIATLTPIFQPRHQRQHLQQWRRFVNNIFVCQQHVAEVHEQKPNSSSKRKWKWKQRSCHMNYQIAKA